MVCLDFSALLILKKYFWAPISSGEKSQTLCCVSDCAIKSKVCASVRTHHRHPPTFLNCQTASRHGCDISRGHQSRVPKKATSLKKKITGQFSFQSHSYSSDLSLSNLDESCLNRSNGREPLSSQMLFVFSQPLSGPLILLSKAISFMLVN